MDNARIPSIWEYLHDTPHRLAWVDVAGVQTRYLEAGPADAPPLLLLHGTAGSLENFCANYAAYARHFHVIGLDMLGCGLTDKPPFDYLIARYVEHIAGFMDALGLSRAAFVGVSLGSWVAAALAHAHPQRVARLVMVAPAGIVVDPEEERRFAEGVRARRSAAATQPSWESIATAMRGLVLHADRLGDDMIATRLCIYRQPAMREAMPRLLAFSLSGEHLTHEQWRRIEVPMQVIAAVDAPNMFLRNARAIAALSPRAEVVDIKGCDHWAQYEQPEVFNEVTLRFLRA